MSLDSAKQEHLELPNSGTTELAFSSKLEINFSLNKHLSSRRELPQPPSLFGGQGMLLFLFSFHRLDF
jgi:hypothetical protein